MGRLRDGGGGGGGGLPEGECPSHWVVAVGDERETANQLLCVGHLPEVPLRELEHSQDVEPQEVGRGLGREDVCQLQKSRASHDGERELVH